MKKIVRSVMTNFPYLQDYRFTVERHYRSIMKVPVEKEFEILKKLKPGKVLNLVDIGANRGMTIQGMLDLRPGSVITAFEPNKIVFDKTHKLFSNRENVKVHNVGLGSEEGELSLNIPYYKNFMFDGLGAFDYDEAAHWLKTRMYNYQAKHLSMKAIKCPIKTLDSYDLQPDFIKIDVQGHELQVLKGASGTLKKNVPMLLIETPGEEIDEFLASFGYVPHKWEENQLVPGKGILNTIFLTNALHNELNA